MSDLMSFEEFIPLAIRTESKIAPITLDPAAFDNMISACVAVGNLADLIKKKVAYNKPINIRDWSKLVEDLSFACVMLSDLDPNKVTDGPPMQLNTRLFHGILGLFTESTELVECIQAARADEIDGKLDTWDFTNLKEEVGDAQWYSAIIMDEIGGNMGRVLNTIIEKLKARYPEKFTDENAINRNLAVERQILESK